MSLVNTSKKRKSALVWGVIISNLVIVRWHKLTQTFVEFSHLHFDTSFSSRDYKLTTFDTDLWEMVQIQKLQMKKYHAGIIREQNAMHAGNWITLVVLTGHWGVVNWVEWRIQIWTDQLGSIAGKYSEDAL